MYNLDNILNLLKTGITENDIKNISNSLCVLRNNEEHIINYIKNHNYFYALETYNNYEILSLHYFYKLINTNLSFQNFLFKYIHVFIFWSLLRNYLYNPENFKLLNINVIQIKYLKTDNEFILWFLNIYGYKQISYTENNLYIISEFEFNINNIQKIYNYPIINEYKYQFVFFNKIYIDLFYTDIPYEQLKKDDKIHIKNISLFHEIINSYNINFNINNSLNINNIITFGNTKNIRLYIKDNFSKILYDYDFLQQNYNLDLIY